MWKPGFEPDRTKIVEEFADILAFLGTWVMLLELMGITSGELAQAYMLKRQKNVARFAGASGEAGYTGIANKGGIG